jgi:hypothetical protein
VPARVVSGRETGRWLFGVVAVSWPRWGVSLMLVRENSGGRLAGAPSEEEHLS